MNIASRIFCYPLLEHALLERDCEIARLRQEVKDWQNKALNREGFSPLGTEEEERAVGGDVARSAAFDLRPPIAQAQARWEEEEQEEVRRYVPPLSSDEQIDILEEAETLNQ